MLLRHGKVCAEGYAKPFGKDFIHNIYSVTKSFVSTAIGLAIEDKLINLNDKVYSLFPEKIDKELHPATAALEIKDLLEMKTVHPKSTPLNGDDWIKDFLYIKPCKIPGTIFAYDSTGVNILCAIIQKVTNMNVYSYLKERLFDKLDMDIVIWDNVPMNINNGGGGIKTTAENMAKFGQLYLQNGLWNGEQIIPKIWVEAATKKHSDTYNTRFMLDSKKGYGLLFWIGRNNSYYAFGMGGQFVLVIPEKDIVFVSTANTLLFKDGQAQILDSFWSCIYPSICDYDLESSEEDVLNLKNVIDNMVLALPDGKTYSPIFSELSHKQFVLDDNYLNFKTCKFEFTDDICKLFLDTNEKCLNISFKMNSYIIDIDPITGLKSANGAVWINDNTLSITTQLFDFAQMFIITCSFVNNAVSILIQPAGELKDQNLECHINGSLKCTN
jgi:CubicO group peptidase (beta-lactamase class C family)